MAKKKTKRASFKDDPKPKETPTDTGIFPPEEGDNIQQQFGGGQQQFGQQPVGGEQIQPGTPQQGGMDQMAVFSQMMQSFQSMMNLGALPQQWNSSQPFQQTETEIEPESVSHDIIMPKTLERGIIVQSGLNIHPLFSKLFMNYDGTPLNGIPKGCTITLTGPSYTGKTRAALEMIANAASQGVKTAYVVAEEGFYDQGDSGRNDLFSRFLQVATNTTGLSEKEFRAKHDDDYVIIPNQYHLGKTWSDFIKDYRYVIETLNCKLTIIDSINMLDPSKLNTVDNLNALKTYNHEKGITCVVIGQVKDSGVPQGGEALFHTSEVSIHIYSMTMTSKLLAEKWGSEYRESVTLVSARSKVSSTVSFPLKIIESEHGLTRADPNQPDEHELPKNFWE